MARGVNKVTLLGNLGNDPQVHQTNSGGTVVNAQLATCNQWRDKETGELQESTEWHRLVFFNRLAEIIAEYAKKGTKMYVEGRLHTKSYQDKNDVKKFSTEIIVHEMQFLNKVESGAATNSAGFEESKDDYDDVPF